MNCCPCADFHFLPSGVETHEKNNQADSVTLQFFPFKAIQSVRYSYSRDDGGTLSLWILANGSPGAGGISYRYHFPCSDYGRQVYQKIVENV